MKSRSSASRLAIASMRPELPPIGIPVPQQPQDMRPRDTDRTKIKAARKATRRNRRKR